MPDYNPNQLRVPRGQSTGGQWTREGHGSFQPIYFAPARQLNDAKPSDVQRAFAPAVVPVVSPAIVKSIELGLLLLTLQAARTAPGEQSGVGINASGYAITEDKLDLENVRPLTAQDVKKYCGFYKRVKAKTDEAAHAVNEEIAISMEKISSAVYGSKVHHRLAQFIRTKMPRNVGVEASALKIEAEAGLSRDEAKEEVAKFDARYGQKGTVRVDVIEWGRDQTICVYDVKTGKSHLSDRRMEELASTIHARAIEIARNINKAHPGAKPRQIFVIEVNPAENRPSGVVR